MVEAKRRAEVTGLRRHRWNVVVGFQKYEKELETVEDTSEKRGPKLAQPLAQDGISLTNTKFMRYCYHCGQITAGEPLFCSSCARTYNVKLCPRLHVNSRSAEVCSQCGSRELSTPQPRVSVWWKVLEFLTKLAVGVCLVYLSLAGFAALLKTAQFQNALFVFGVLVGLLWWLWSELPEWFRKLVRRSLTRKERNHEH